MTVIKFLSNSSEQTIEIAKKISKQIKQGGLICLYGDLGSGKTVFTKGLAEELGHKKFSIKSPTFTYIRKLGHSFYHIDLYRLEYEDQLLWYEIKEILNNPGNIVVIEWADKFKKLKKFSRVEVNFKYKSLNQRLISIKYD